jgi:hypothetical protein
LGFGVVIFSSVKLLVIATVQKFEELEVWQMARELCQKVYPLTFEEPIEKDFRYKDQLRGTCGSIMDNIAEGFGRGSRLSLSTVLQQQKEKPKNLNHNFIGALMYTILLSTCLRNYMTWRIYL